MFTFCLYLFVCVVGEVIYVEVRGQFVGLGSSVTWILGIELKSPALVEKPLSADPSLQGRSYWYSTKEVCDIIPSNKNKQTESI